MIDKDWVMTAASCCINMIPATLHIVAGGIELINWEHEEQTRNLKRIISHPEFERYTKVNDICLLQLQVSGDLVTCACDDCSDIPRSRWCSMSGWRRWLCPQLARRRRQASLAHSAAGATHT